MHKLRVLGGLNAGAEIALEPHPYTVGSDDGSCDIVLAHDSVPARAFALLCTEPRRVTLEVFEADTLRANDSLLSTGGHELDLPVHLQLGDSDLLIGIGAQATPPIEPEPPAASLADAPPAPVPAGKARLYGAVAVPCALFVGLLGA